VTTLEQCRFGAQGVEGLIGFRIGLAGRREARQPSCHPPPNILLV
jgi:hypothetical protein